MTDQPAVNTDLLAALQALLDEIEHYAQHIFTTSEKEEVLARLSDISNALTALIPPI